jgi:glycosyltransferase involved in cell wall biosynthesis
VRYLIGSETQHSETVSVVSGISRVVRNSHVGLFDRLTPRGFDLVPFHMKPGNRSPAFLDSPYLADDPVLYLTRRPLDELDAFLLLDVSLGVDFGPLVTSLRRRNRPVIALIHDVIPLTVPGAFEEEAQMAFRLYLQQVLHVASHIVVTSEQCRKNILALGWSVCGDIHVIPLGSGFQNREPLAQPDERISVLYVSTLEPRKGHYDLLDAFDMLLADGHDVDLTIVGQRGWSVGGVFDVDDLIQRIRDHPEFGGRLKWLQAADDLTLTTRARSCNIGVFPSRDEGFGLFVEEGLALGLKMVVSDIPVFREREQSNLTFSRIGSRDFADAILNAHTSSWHLPVEPVRTMCDFVDDLASLIMKVVTAN